MATRGALRHLQVPTNGGQPSPGGWALTLFPPKTPQNGRRRPQRFPAELGQAARVPVHCSGEIFRGIMIRDSIVRISGTAKHSGGGVTSQLSHGDSPTHPCAHPCSRHSHPSPASSRPRSLSPLGTAGPCMLQGGETSFLIPPPQLLGNGGWGLRCIRWWHCQCGVGETRPLTPEVVHDIQLPDLREEAAHCLLVLLAVLYGPSPVKWRETPGLAQLSLCSALMSPC